MKIRLRIIIKKMIIFVISLFFICQTVLTYNAFAAIVSDNDGSAFVTKSEFDSLKKNFADQIDNYNTSIDSKIDGAIAYYLAGIKLDKKTELKNLYKSITDKHDIYWVSGQYSRTSGKPVPKLKFYFNQAFNTTAYEIEASWNGSNLYLYEGTETTDGKYHVDYLMDLDAVFEEHESYFLADQQFNTLPNSSYNPYDSGMTAQMSLIKPSIYTSHHYTPNGSGTSRSNFRGILSAYFYKEDKGENRNLMFTPWSTANTYAHISNNKDKISNADNRFPYYPYNSSSSRYSAPTLRDTRIDTTKQTINPATATKRSDYYVQAAKLDSMYFPWLQKQWVMNEIYYKIANEATGENMPIKYGVKICETSGEGEIEIKMKSDQAGIGIFHIGNPISSWPKTANLDDDTTRIYSTKNLAANEEGTVKFDCKKNEKVWFVYCGADDGAGCQVEFTSIMQTENM